MASNPSFSSLRLLIGRPTRIRFQHIVITLILKRDEQKRGWPLYKNKRQLLSRKLHPLLHILKRGKKGKQCSKSASILIQFPLPFLLKLIDYTFPILVFILIFIQTKPRMWKEDRQINPTKTRVKHVCRVQRNWCNS